MSNFAVRKKHVVIIGNYADYHYTESFMYDKQGNIRNLTRWDNSDIMNLLSFQYSGNQLVKVSDNGYPPISYDEKRYHDDSNDQIEFQYDQNGNVIYDSDRKICSIRYNVLNLPDTIQFSDGKQIVHVYDAEGTRLQTTYYTPKVTMTVPPFSVLISTDNLQNYNIVSYAMVGNKRYVRSGHGSWQLQDVLNPEGYTRYYTPEEHYRFYYIKDHLGNVREVYVNPDPGYKECVQRTQYYPTGLPWNEGMYPSEQPFKYNGKEFVEMHGLDEYDSEARWYYPAIMRTTTMDPLCEKYYSISPYAWCNNNPVNLVDPDGRIGVLVSALISATIGAGVEATSQVTSSVINGASLREAVSDIKYSKVAIAGVSGLLGGASNALKLAKGVKMAVDVGLSVAESVANSYADNKNLSDVSVGTVVLNVVAGEVAKGASSVKGSISDAVSSTSVCIELKSSAQSTAKKATRYEGHLNPNKAADVRQQATSLQNKVDLIETSTEVLDEDLTKKLLSPPQKTK